MGSAESNGYLRTCEAARLLLRQLGMPTQRHPVRQLLLVLAVGTMSPSAFGAAAEYEPPLAQLLYPRPDAIDVPGTTRIFAERVTALSLEGPNGEQLPTTLDPSRPYYQAVAFVPFDDLAPGVWTVKGLPTAEADNWAGEGVTIDLGSFTVTDRTVDAFSSVEITGARWTMIRQSADWLSVEVSADGAVAQPIFIEADLADATHPMDGEPELSTVWTQSMAVIDYVDEEAMGFDPNTATVRVRVTDASGNVTDWSAPRAFEVGVGTTSVATGCSAAPGTTGGAGTLAVLLALVLGLVTRRR